MEGRVNKKTVLFAFISTMMLGFVPAVTVSASAVARPDHMIVATVGEPWTVDPAWAYDTASQELIFNVYESLIFFDVDRTRPPAEAGLMNQFVPALATEWSISADGMTYTFKMRDGVTWHDGTVSTAAEMAANAEYSFERWMIQDRSGGPTWMILEPLLGVYWAELTEEYAATVDAAVQYFTNATGSYVQLNLVMSYPPFLTIIAQSWAGILNKGWVAANGGFPGLDVTGYDPAVWGQWNDPWFSPLDDYPVGTGGHVMMGTGPYMFDYWEHEVEWSIVRNVDYWRGWPAQESGGGYPEGWIERATVRIVPEWSTRKSGFLAGDYDMVYVPRKHIPELILNWVPGSWSAPDLEEYPPGIRCNKDIPSLAISPVMFFNFDIATNSPYLGPGFDPANPYIIAEDRIPINFFSDKDVRKAFAYAFDYDKYIREVYMGEASQPATPVIEGLPYHNPDQDKYSFNLTKTEQHFRAAWSGQVWTNGFTMTLVYRPGNVPRQKAWEMLKTSVESLNSNFHINIEEEWPWWIWPFGWLRRYPMIISGWLADYPDPHNFVHPFMHSDGVFAYWQRYSNATVDALVEEGIRTLNETRRREIYYQLQKIYHDEVPSVPLVQPVGRHWERDWVQGWYYNPTYPGSYFYHLWKGYLGDTDKDYDVDLTDLYNVLIGYGLTIEDAIVMYGVPSGTDVDKDGMVDLDDLYWVLINYG